MQSSRARFAAAAGAFAAIAIARYPARAAEFSYKLALSGPPSYPPVARCIEAAGKILSESGGRLEVQVFPNGQLGGDVELINQTRLGAIQFYCGGDNNMGTVAPPAFMSVLPFIVSNTKEALSLLDGAFGAYVSASLAKVGLYRFPFSWDVGFNVVQNNIRPIHTPADLRGLKLKVAETPVYISLFKALGATAVPLNAPEMYPGLQTHLVDGTTSGLIVVESFRLYEVEKYNSNVNFAWAAMTMMGNLNVWQQLPKNLQDILARNFEAARKASNDDVVKLLAGARERLIAHGMVFNDADGAPFEKVVREAGMYGEWKKSYPPEAWSLLEKTVGRTLG